MSWAQTLTVGVTCVAVSSGPRPRIVLRLLRDYCIQTVVESINLRGEVFTMDLHVSS